MMKINVAPVSAIACKAAIGIAFAHSNCLKKINQLDVTIVVSLLSSLYDACIESALILMDWVGYDD